MLKRIHKTLSIGLSGLLALGVAVGTVDADTVGKRVPNVLHEMVPHVVLPETIQYNKTAKNLPGNGYNSANSPYVATYVAFPSYQTPYTAEFRSVGQSVYPVSPQVPPPLPKETQPQEGLTPDTLAVEAVFAVQCGAAQDIEGRDVVLSQNITEPIRLASGAEEMIPTLPSPNSMIVQTGIFCQQPAKPPSAWSFSSPLFKIASVPSPWAGQHAGSITHHSPRGSGQHVAFAPAGADPGATGAMPQGVPYSTMQMGRGVNQELGAQVQVLPNGMVLLTTPATHHNCGLLRCRSNCVPKNVLLPPADYFQQIPQGLPPMQPVSAMQGAMMPNAMMPNAMMPGNYGVPFMPVGQQMPMPQPQLVPITAMTPMGPAIVGYQQVPMMSSQMSMPMPQPAMVNPMIAAQVTGTAGTADEGLQPPGELGNVNSVGINPEGQMGLVATPFGYALQLSTGGQQGDAAAQLAQMQMAQMQMTPMQMMNPYAGFYATPFGYVSMGQGSGPSGGFGQSAMFMPNQGGMSVSDMIQIMALLNNSKPQRQGLFSRMAERREARRAACGDPITELMQAWTTPYITPGTTLRMPARNAYPYGHFGVQASPISTANYGGYNNLYLGNTTYPGLY